METAKPFVVTRKSVVEGGLLNKPWIVDVKIFDDKEYIKLQQTNRNLAKALGMDLKQRSPLTNAKVFGHLAKVRNDRVDKLILQSQRSSDPMADVDGAPADDLWVERGREKAFQTASVPVTVAIKLGAFVTGDGESIVMN